MIESQLGAEIILVRYVPSFYNTLIRVFHEKMS